jgi:hypothetical protein
MCFYKIFILIKIIFFKYWYIKIIKKHIMFFFKLNQFKKHFKKINWIVKTIEIVIIIVFQVFFTKKYIKIIY